jgi:lipid A 3-O-deacylase
MKRNRAGYLAVICSCVCALARARAGGDLRTLRTADIAPDQFSRGSQEIEELVGAYFLFDRGGNERVSVDYLINTVRYGAMLYNPSGPGILRGNVEAVAEVFAGGIFHGPGSVVAGVAGFVRYNFVQPSARIVPYFQGGGGFVYSDIKGEDSSRAISLSVEFNLQAVAGIRFIVNPQWSVLTELGYRHISNASTRTPNYGLDQLGGNLGFGFSF